MLSILIVNYKIIGFVCNILNDAAVTCRFLFI